jgi:hypothetical protein
MTTNDLTSAEKTLFDYEKEFQISVCKQTEAMAEKGGLSALNLI